MCRTLIVSLVLAAAGCGLPEAERYLVYDVDAATRAYALAPATIVTLRVPGEGRGDVARLRAGGRLVPSLSEADDEREIEASLTMHDDRPPDIQFTIDEDGVAVPWDFESTLMLTLYHHLERASAFFASAGVPLTRVRRLDVYYDADLDIPLLPTGPLLTDNAAYVMTLDAFYVPPRRVLDDVPLVANRGVITHEYAHAVFNRLVHDDDRVPAFLLEEWPAAAVNELRSVDEGLADTFAALAVGDPNFIAPSVDVREHDLDRDLSVERHYTQTLRDEVSNAELLEYDPYVLGSVVASTMWATRAHLADLELAQALVAALDALPVPTDTFALAQVMSAFVAQVDETRRPAVCALLQERLEAIAGEITCSL